MSSFLCLTAHWRPFFGQTAGYKPIADGARKVDLSFLVIWIAHPSSVLGVLVFIGLF